MSDNTWSPQCQSGKGSIGTDFVVIRNTTQTQREWSIEGVVVETDGPVAIRVDIHGKSEAAATDLRDHRDFPNNPGLESKDPDSGGCWVPVANGALLRARKTSGIKFSIYPNYQGRIILFPSAYVTAPPSPPYHVTYTHADTRTHISP